MENKDEKNINVQNIQTQMRKGILEYCILLAMDRGEIYSSDILTELKNENLLVVEGTLYPLLSRLRTNGLLDYAWRESKNGPPRKYYKLTEQGKKTLKQLNKTWSNLSLSVNSLKKKYEKNN
ncbi:MAG: PadR family transcriptional regulator [Patescibacteria group bacterium]